MSYKKLYQLTAIFSFPLTILLVSYSSLRIVGEGNSYVDVFLSFMIFLGFIELFHGIRKALVWLGWKNGN
ncbi:microcin immunity protein [Salmonella enterica subsp. salamae]|uniref:Microcin immunity protein n=1 Tax=Salmonella enterica subsp. salamae TaxID=59202 RepID=A0A5Y3V6E9_SALER|nr:microcin immunity protein [Salmonella enterica subsp. salamae]EDH0694568.1 microcin immunity protein [Salmonella enterica]EHM1751053.1 microcin immunity protein [Salmonella enterica subsp. salamae serovar 40:c:e,n,x,z15]ECI3453629.1 microcin immunity protein [Salmonella enterica subsp. salamae]ECJ2328087.1 microcin immunity protein [Salmonella enterica subsp. salamae]